MSSFDKITYDKIKFINSIFPGLTPEKLTYRQLDDLHMIISACYSGISDWGVDSPEPRQKKNNHKIRIAEWLDD